MGGLGKLLPGSGNAIADAPAGYSAGASAPQTFVAFESRGLMITFSCCKQSDGSCSITAKFCNSLDKPMENFKMKAAVQKSAGHSLILNQATSTTLPARSDSVIQTMSVVKQPNSDSKLAMKLMIRYTFKGDQCEEMGDVNNFPPGL